MTNPKIIILQQKRDELNKILENYSQWSKVEIWISGISSIIKLQFPEYFEEFESYCKTPNWTYLPRTVARSKYSLPAGGFIASNPSLNDENRVIEQANNKRKGQDAIQKLLSFLDTLIQLSSSELISHNSEDILTILERIFSHFHRINLQLQNRYSNRPTIQIDDEYDVQDLLHALLTLYFDDIRSEEFTISSAGRNSRSDFLLKREKVMIEAKKTRQGLKDGKLGDELKVDISSYKHPDASTLVCFVYDPDALINNPNAIIDDLEKLSRDELSVRVFIYPRH
jgi:hypothetical protein